MASACWRGCYRAPSLVPRFSRSKYTAPPTAKQLVNQKISVNTKSSPRIDRVDQSRVGINDLSCQHHLFIHQVEVDYARALNRANEEVDHEEDIFAFQNLTSLEAQMESLKTKGFLRSYKAYQPPADLAPRFMSICSEVLGVPVVKESLDSFTLDSLDKKAELLKALHMEFDHMVHSSRLHEMKTLGRLFLFYSSEVCSLNPYEQLHRDKEADLLPSNLVIEKDPIRFTGQGDHPLDQVGCLYHLMAS